MYISVCMYISMYITIATLLTLIWNWLSIKHSLFVLQVYRRGRALRKFARQLTEGKIVMSSRSMQNYIMPYAMIAVVDEKLLKVVTYFLMIFLTVSIVMSPCCLFYVFLMDKWFVFPVWTHENSRYRSYWCRVQTPDLVQVLVLHKTLRPYFTVWNSGAETGSQVSLLQ